jgi:hypothetical protein
MWPVQGVGQELDPAKAELETEIHTRTPLVDLERFQIKPLIFQFNI